jgi:hypothetical protein
VGVPNGVQSKPGLASSRFSTNATHYLKLEVQFPLGFKQFQSKLKIKGLVFIGGRIAHSAKRRALKKLGSGMSIFAGLG